MSTGDRSVHIRCGMAILLLALSCTGTPTSPQQTSSPAADRLLPSPSFGPGSSSPTVPDLSPTLAEEVQSSSPTTEPILWTGPLLSPIWVLSDSVIQIYDLGARQLHLFTSTEEVDSVLGWSPDGCILSYLAGSNYVTGEEGTVHHLHLGTLEEEPIFAVVSTPGVIDPASIRFRWSPDAEWIAYSTEASPITASEVYLVRPDGSEHLRLTNDGYWDRLHSWSADARSVLYWAHLPAPGQYTGWREGIWHLKRLDIDSREVETLVRYTLPLESWADVVITDSRTLQSFSPSIAQDPQDVRHLLFFWTPDLRRYALMTAEGLTEWGYARQRLYWIDLEGQLTQQLQFEEILVEDLSPSGGLLLFSGLRADGTDAECNYWVLDMQAGEVSSPGPDISCSLWRASWSPDENFIALMSDWERACYVYDLDTGEVFTLSENLYARFWPIDWSPRMFYDPGVCEQDGAGP